MNTDQFTGTREAFAAALTDLSKQDKKYVMISADSVKTMRATEYAVQYPDRVFDAGIAEQNAVDMAAGMASCGLIPFVSTYSGFITMRACEQLRTFVAYPKLNVKFVGVNGGVFGGEREGVSHQFFEDIGILRSIPGITIINPADDVETYHAVKAAAAIDGPAFVRIGSGREHRVFTDSIDFQLGKARILRDNGNDVAIFTSGLITNRVLEAADRLDVQGIGYKLIEVHTLKPLDTDTVSAALKATGRAVTVEDHNVIGGLGSAIAETAAQYAPAHILRVGLQDIFPSSGEAEEVLDAYGIGVQDIVKTVDRVIQL